MAEGRGHLKVFIGMAPGVGKTYRMLQEGAAEAANGRDVVIGYLESHGREETLAQADGLEAIPRSCYIGTCRWRRWTCPRCSPGGPSCA
jgi:two-component system, OmpR family, sensor histidine kinase KdpD